MKALQCDTIEWMNEDNLAMHQVLEDRREATVIYVYNNKRMLALQSYVINAAMYVLVLCFPLQHYEIRDI